MQSQMMAGMLQSWQDAGAAASGVPLPTPLPEQSNSIHHSSPANASSAPANADLDSMNAQIKALQQQLADLSKKLISCRATSFRGVVRVSYAVVCFADVCFLRKPHGSEFSPRCYRPRSNCKGIVESDESATRFCSDQIGPALLDHFWLSDGTRRI